MLINEQQLHSQLEQQALARKAELQGLSNDIAAANALAHKLQTAGISCSATANLGLISISIWIQTHGEDEAKVIDALDSLGIQYHEPSTEADYPSSWRVFEMNGYNFPLIYGHKYEIREEA
jgi:translation initiation factor 1 (eIF-1/SUI1)